MKKIFAAALIALLSMVFVLPAADSPAYGAEVDSYVDRKYDFAQMKRICVWPVEYENIPENVRLSLPNLIGDWMEDFFADRKRMRFVPLLKSTKQMWKDIQFIKGPLDFDDPFESAEAAEKFYSMLGEACEGVLEVNVSVTQKRRWQEPRIKTYETTERVRKVERRRNRNGRWEEVETYIDMPVTKERVIPGYWLIDTRAECGAELYDSRDPDGKFVAAARADERSTNKDGDAMQNARDAAKKALTAALGSIFYK